MLGFLGSGGLSGTLEMNNTYTQGSRNRAQSQIDQMS